MADVSIEIEGDSPEAVALALLNMIVKHGEPEEDEERDREWFLQTYAACLAVVRDAAVIDLDDEEEEDEGDDEEDDEDDEDEEEMEPGAAPARN
jgi:Ran GTPase-activating protein (RanGAP) involved in mRNA processing and transport